MKIYPTNDLELIERTIKHPRVFPHVTDDDSIDPSDWKPELSDEVTYLAVSDDPMFYGIFVLIQKSPICFEIHSCLLPTAYGITAIVALSGAIDWAWRNTTCRRIVAGIPDDNTLAYRLAKNAGMEDYGLNPDCVIRGGRLRSMKLVGISKGAAN